MKSKVLVPKLWECIGFTWPPSLFSTTWTGASWIRFVPSASLGSHQTLALDSPNNQEKNTLISLPARQRSDLRCSISGPQAIKGIIETMPAGDKNSPRVEPGEGDWWATALEHLDSVLGRADISSVLAPTGASWGMNAQCTGCELANACVPLQDLLKVLRES